jgi:hypothetical protein
MRKEIALVVDMAKPIEPTPILEGKDAERFLRSMLNEQSHPDPKRLDFLKEAMASFKKYHVRY